MKKSKRILLIDDDTDDQVYFLDAISEINPSIECEIANNGLEGLQQIKVPPPFDIIFLDLNMPIMNGFECLNSLKRSALHKEIPIIIFTTSKSSDDIERSRQLGAALFFTKPTNFKVLCNKLKHIFDSDLSKSGFII